MTKIANPLLAAALLLGSAFAQQTAPQTQPAANPPQAPTSNQPAANSATPRFAPGTVLPVELTKSIDAKKAKTGDGVEAKVTQDLKSQNGQVIVPKDTKVVGHVTEAQPRTKDQKESQVGIVFDHAVIKGANDVSMPMSIQAIIAPTALGAPGNNAGASTQPGDAYPGSSSAPSGASGRAAGTNPGTPSSTTPSTTGGEAPATTQTAQNPHEQITANTQGVVGISNLKLSSPAESKSGSVVTSDKGNVKLESGTFMLLRVNE